MDADKFDYKNSSITPFDGEEIPFENDKFDGLMCTEVLEHVYHYQKLIDEMYRVMKKGGMGILTVPWGGRYHYIPFDYFRYTPSSYKIMFDKFSKVEISPRGTDIANIANKLIVIWARGIVPFKIFKLIFLPVWIISLLFLGIVVVLAHLSLSYNIGSQDDPLGYTIRIVK